MTPTDQVEACQRPPAGWWCSREAGHEGPCAAREMPPISITATEALSPEDGQVLNRLMRAALSLAQQAGP